MSKHKNVNVRGMRPPDEVWPVNPEYVRTVAVNFGKLTWTKLCYLCKAFFIRVFNRRELEAAEEFEISMHIPAPRKAKICKFF